MTHSKTIAHLSVLVAALGVLFATPASARYNPETGDDVISEVEIRISPGDRVNSPQQLRGWLGVQQCRDLRERNDGQVRFEFYRSQAFSTRAVEVEGAYLMEVNPAEGLPGDRSCDFEETDGCTLIDAANYDGVWVEDEQWPVEVRFDFERLLELDDGVREDCEFSTRSSTNSLFAPNVPPSMHVDGGLDAHAGDAGTDAYASDTWSDDTYTGSNGSGSDDTSTGGTNTQGTGSSSYEDDRAYVVRLLLSTRTTDNLGNLQERTLLSDGPLIFDRTRPSPPTKIRAAATQNILRVRFTPPEERNRLDSYYAFYSTSAFPAGVEPEGLEERDDVWRGLLGSVREDDSDRTSTIRDIEQQDGTKLWVAVVSRDSAENYSQLQRMEGSIEVKRSIDFWEQYLSSGGEEFGGCGCSNSRPSPDGLLWGLLGLGILAFTRTRRRAR